MPLLLARPGRSVKRRVRGGMRFFLVSIGKNAIARERTIGTDAGIAGREMRISAPIPSPAAVPFRGGSAGPQIPITAFTSHSTSGMVTSSTPTTSTTTPDLNIFEIGTRPEA